MTRVGAVAALWAVFAFVTWNVLFDRQVMVSAVEFTRDQIVRHQNGDALISIHEGFSPSVRQAALQATLWVVPILALGALATFLTFRRVR
ncbi:MAG TPA: hypothetical protein VMO26_10925 [Vicinamibacterales bacterium]|nr:hypothetical protein [Vicinamibacterales bacterium]